MSPYPAPVTRYFHVRGKARKEFKISEELFSVRGDVLFVNFQQSRLLAEQINTTRKDGGHVNPADLNAMGLIHEILHFVIGMYREERNPTAFAGLLAHLNGAFTQPVMDRLLLDFTTLFPPPDVASGKQKPDVFLNGSIDGIPNRHWMLEEMIMVWLNNENPGYAPIKPIIHDAELREGDLYLKVIASAQAFFETQPKFGPDNQNLIDLLYEPIRRAPNSLMDQLDFIRRYWGSILSGSAFWLRLLTSMDYIREEGKWFLFKQGGWNVSKDITAEVPSFSGDLFEHEPEAFSPDTDWMPRVVMIAKSSFVWLDQLTKRYQRPITFLSDIPDEELDALQNRGITALWLIGLWKRSHASARIKQINGNPEAVASAYSLYDYDIADELGGYPAYENLRNRCAGRGIRLASDMVPNHMGIDSSWVMNEPDLFLSLPYPPYPNYRYNGVDLSNDPRIGLYVEDGYWDRTDAAVTFKRVDRWTGDVRYILHGNDGTSFPWNDTAQLNYLKAEVREKVIQTIIHVARMFPIIRFDAAMTLAKRHYQRLWFPLPGTGGDIPSRSEHAMTKEEFDRWFPVEFWREVVDRIAVEVPNTLLLAEAFWMMEGYFVRTLGMHRVYNSAFMHMFKKEDNQNYRYLIKNTLEFNPQILKRYVNFMNNPDEETAVNQFGKGDKYFGVALMMATLPGLPMFGHGQFEGFSEKYGMEYKKAYKDEQPDQWLIDRHMRELVPVIKKRYLFAEVEQFLLYDFFTGHGGVNEDVFAFSNRFGHEKALVVFHNRYAHTSGWVRTSAAYLDPKGHMTQRVLGQGLALPVGDDNQFTIFRDAITGNEFIRSTQELWERGMHLDLQAFEYHVFWEFRQVTHTDAMPYRDIANFLHGKGVPSIEDAIIEMKLKPIFDSWYQAINPGAIGYYASGADTMEPKSDILNTLNEKLSHIGDGARFLFGHRETEGSGSDAVLNLYRKLIHWSRPVNQGVMPVLGTFIGSKNKSDKKTTLYWNLTLSWLIADQIDRWNLPGTDYKPACDAFYLTKTVTKSLRESGYSDHDAWRYGMVFQAMCTLSNRYRHHRAEGWTQATALTLTLEHIRPFLQINLHNDVLWFNKESMDEMVTWLSLTRLLLTELEVGTDRPDEGHQKAVDQALASTIRQVDLSGYRYQELVQSMMEPAKKPKKGAAAQKPAAKKKPVTKPAAKKKAADKPEKAKPAAKPSKKK